MAAKFDVEARLAEARQAVDNAQNYVWASGLLGYQNPDLTLHPAQVRDWFSSEDGMDLRVLDADSSAVQAVAAAADDALARQRDQLAALVAAWQGAGAEPAEDFLRRHCDSAENVTAGVRTAAESLAALRDTLWQDVDTKVAAVIAIDNRRPAERTAWLAAAQTVTTGVGDRAAASELVDQQVKPFVDNDIRNDWLTAVRTAIASISRSYDAATASIIPADPVRFDVPGDLGPASAPPRHDDVAAPRDAAPAPSAPTGPSQPSPTPSYPSSPAMPAMAATPATPADVPTASAAPTPSAVPATPSSGLEGMSQPVADALRGLLPSSGDGTLPDEPALDAPTVGDEPDDASAGDESDDKTDDEKDCNPGENDLQAPGVDDAAPAAEPSSPPPEPPPRELPDMPPTPPAPDVPPEVPTADMSTPCEIAASELPQAGE